MADKERPTMSLEISTIERMLSGKAVSRERNLGMARKQVEVRVRELQKIMKLVREKLGEEEVDELQRTVAGIVLDTAQDSDA